MKKCINLLKCPACNSEEVPDLITDELGATFRFVCSECMNAYGAVLEPNFSLDLDPNITFETYKRVCETWQKGVCGKLGIEYKPCKFE